MSGITFDAGGLIALDRNDRQVIVLLARARELGVRVVVPATALAQAVRNPARQARLSRLIRQADTDLVPLHAPTQLLWVRIAGGDGDGGYRRCSCRDLRAEGGPVVVITQTQRRCPAHQQDSDSIGLREVETARFHLVIAAGRSLVGGM